jgi:hypothetical protein
MRRLLHTTNTTIHLSMICSSCNRICLSYQYHSTKSINICWHTAEMLEYHNGQVAIHPTKHDKLVIALRTAVENGEGMLDKDATSYDDLFDAFRSSLMFWH